MLFFFFQAEDGIRDLTVTGVQTCALPISASFGSSVYQSSASTNTGVPPAKQIASTVGNAVCDGTRISSPGFTPSALKIIRSEERRVGKECRSRWSPYH